MAGSPPQWLIDSVIYQVYPQSFADGNGDGVGDLAGILQRLDHLEWLGITTIWLNPCFASPFTDAGYDVADFLRVAERYGDNDDLVALIDAAHQRGMRVLLDLVAGHTSDRHAWFADSAARDDGVHADRYIWTSGRANRPPGFHPSPGGRDGCYLPNFFTSQPALNFGYARTDPDEPWRQSPDDPGPTANRAALREIMAFWLDRGADGFRVDMAASLVKDDADGTETARLWTELRAWLDRDHPDAVLLSEWGDPAAAVNAGFHLDFFLHFVGRAFRSLMDNGAGVQVPDWPPGPCFFDAEGMGSAVEFLDAWESATAAMKPGGLICLPTSNHDFPRLSCGDRNGEQLRPAMVVILTWPTVPAIYYGDEIGMRYVPGLPAKEGSSLGDTYNRAGSRTPMQWNTGPGAGFSSAPADRLYLPIDPAAGAPTVSAQRDDSDSLLHLVRQLIALRRDNPALGPAGDVTVLAGRTRAYPLVFLRGKGDQRFIVAVNPRRTPATAAVPGYEPVEPVITKGALWQEGQARLDGFGYGIWRLVDP
ncbi:alpha-amylase family glycosyl hydrolase [Stackebrandtia soli]|uniref:alpha-amylase family glycosyl hydrolase n=1 Tax=Stackebrandtia soli TaxID=1892856 RepID=UPI0039EA15D5